MAGKQSGGKEQEGEGKRDDLGKMMRAQPPDTMVGTWWQHCWNQKQHQTERLVQSMNLPAAGGIN